MPNLVRLSVVLALFAGVADRALGQVDSATSSVSVGAVAKAWHLEQPGDTAGTKSYVISAVELTGFLALFNALRPRRLRQSDGRRQESLRLDVLDDLGSRARTALGARRRSVQRESVRASVSGRHDVRHTSIDGARFLAVIGLFGCRQLRLGDGRRDHSSVDQRPDHDGPGWKPARRGALSDGGPRPQGQWKQVRAPAS